MLSESRTTGFPKGPRSTSAKALASFLLGLSVSTGVVYVFIVGNTPVYIGYAVATIAVACLFLHRSRGLVEAVAAIDKSILTFCGIAALSLVPSLAYALSGNLGAEAPETVIKGLVILVAGVVVYIAAVSLREQRKLIITGVSAGILINLIFSLAAQASFEAGTVFSLITLFPQDAFVVPLHWGVAEPAGSHAIYTFRAQGLFLEASHLMVFLVAWGLLGATSVKHTFARAALLAGVAYISAQALSPNVAILLLEVALFLVASKVPKEGGRRPDREKRLPHATIVAIIVLLFAAILFALMFGDAISGLFASIVSSLGDLDVISSTDTGTAARFDSMLTTLSILPSYPLGAGWNTESVVLTENLGSSVFASHSFALRLLLEVGPLGLLAYCWVVWRHTVEAYRVSKQGRFVAIAIVCMTIAQFVNGITLLPYVWLLFGIAKGMGMEHAEAEERRADSRLRGQATLSER